MNIAKIRLFPLLFLWCAAGVLRAAAATYHVDPATGSMSNPGTAAEPWSTLQAVFAAGKTFAPGDTILLRSGDHGFPAINQANAGDVTITKEAGAAPVLNRVDFIGAAHWVLEGVEVFTTAAPPAPPILVHPVPAIFDNTLVRIAQDSSDITVKNCTIYSIADSSAWTADDWNFKAWNGIYVHTGSHHVTVDGCDVKNVNFGIHMNANTHHLVIRNSIVQNFCGDGLRANCSDLVIENNIIRDVYETSGNHYDIIQGFASARVVIRGNVILNTTSARPFISEAQAIGCFDGWFEDWIIENNVVVSGHWHAITLLGARNSRVVNNTVVKNPFSTSSMTPWIQVAPHKDGTPSTGNVVRNNIASSLSVTPGNAVVDSNVVSTDYAALFADYAGLDFHLAPGSPALGVGSSELAPEFDLEGNPRTPPIDAGAYEAAVDETVTAAPVFTPSAGTYFGEQSIAMSSATPDASIRFTLDGSTPTTTDGTLYTGPVVIGASTTLKAIAYAPGLSDSAIRTADYIINTRTSATVTPASGFYSTPLAAAQSGVFTVEFDATPSIAPIDAVIGLALNPPSAFSGLAAIARFNASGAIDAYNGNGYAAVTAIPYSAGSTYHFRMLVDVATHTYSIFVTPPGGSEEVVGTNFAFRSSQSAVTSLANWVVSVVATPGGTMIVDDFTLEGAPPEAPVIFTHPENLTVFAGAPATFVVQATGNPSPAYQWRKDGDEIDGATSATFTIASAQLSDAGSYDVVVSNAAGSVTSAAAQLTITPAPPAATVAIVSPASGTAVSGVITVRAEATHAVGVQFQADGVDLGAEDTSAPFEIAWDTAMVANGSRTLTAIARNIAGANTTSGPVNVTVDNPVPPPGIALSGSGTYQQNFDGLHTGGGHLSDVPWTDDATLPGWFINTQTGAVSIRVFSGSGNTNGIYSLGTTTSSSDRALGAQAGAPTGHIAYGVLFRNESTAPLTLGTLAFRAEQYRYSGAALNTHTVWYQIASDPITALSPASNAGWTPLPALDFSNPVTQANAATLGVPNPGNALNPNTNPAFRVERSSELGLTLSPGEFIMLRILDIDNGGTDHTLAIDDFSLTYSSAVIDVAPEITTQPASLTVTAGEPAVLLVVATGTPEPTYQWWKNGESIDGATGPSFTIANALAADAGDYHVVVSNTAGSVTSEVARLTVSKAPAVVTLAQLDHVYDGTPHPANVTTTPAGLSVVLTYNGSAEPPTTAGVYTVVAAVVDENYHGAATALLVIARAPATVGMGDLRQVYDGTPRAVSVTTHPANLPVLLTYGGSPTPPIYPGSYPVEATIQDKNYTGWAVDTLIVSVTAFLRHAPVLNGGLDGSAQIVLPENITLNGSAWVSGDLLVSGTPNVRLNGQPTFGGALEGPGVAEPSDHRVTLNGGAVLRHLVRRIDAREMPTVDLPPPPAGTRNVVLNHSGQSSGDFATLRNLTLNGNAGDVAVPAGIYGAFTANGNSRLVLGTAGAVAPDVYALERLTLNGNAQLVVAGPVMVQLADGVVLNGAAGSESAPEWLEFRIAAGGLTLNGNRELHGSVVAPTGTVIINGNALLRGQVIADRLIINGTGALEQP